MTVKIQAKSTITLTGLPASNGPVEISREQAQELYYALKQILNIQDFVPAKQPSIFDKMPWQTTPIVTYGHPHTDMPLTLTNNASYKFPPIQASISDEQ